MSQILSIRLICLSCSIVLYICVVTKDIAKGYGWLKIKKRNFKKKIIIICRICSHYFHHAPDFIHLIYRLDGITSHSGNPVAWNLTVLTIQQKSSSGSSRVEHSSWTHNLPLRNKYTQKPIQSRDTHLFFLWRRGDADHKREYIWTYCAHEGMHSSIVWLYFDLLQNPDRFVSALQIPSHLFFHFEPC